MAMILLEKSQNAPIDEIFNVGRGEEVKDIRVFDSVIDSMEEYCRTNQNADLKAKVAAVREPIFQAVRPGEVIHSSVSSEKAKAYMGWRPETTFDKGVYQTVKSYLEERLAMDSK
jgi:dTDP-D-glucose 4,6-dehydratase